MYKNNVITNIQIKKCKGNAGMTASLHPFRPLSALVSARLDAQTKKKCGWLDRVFQSAAGLTAVKWRPLRVRLKSEQIYV